MLRKTLNSITQANMKDKICDFIFLSQILSPKKPFFLLNNSLQTLVSVIPYGDISLLVPFTSC